ncbi:MAG: NAD(P)-dependent oxidoreductase [Burkholderiales bacterium]|nr:NAD(P)-dependent oxidoreductase [Burkholderiales bacterium]
MTVLIVGGGLVGSQVARILVERGERPVVMDRAPQRESLAAILDPAGYELVHADVLAPFALSQAIGAHGVRAIVHTAANPMLTAGAQQDPYAAIQLNIMGTVNVLEAARIHGVRRVVVSSSSVLNEYLAGGEAAGDLTLEEALPRPTTFYSATKQAVESLGLNYARHCGIEFAGMRYGPVAGPWLGAGGGEPTNLFRRVIEAAVRGEEALIPAMSMQWVYSKDAAAATVLALGAAPLANGIFNITMGRMVTPEEFAAALAAEFPGVRTRIQAAQAHAAAHRPAAIENARRVLGYVPQYGMREAIRDYAAWLRARG